MTKFLEVRFDDNADKERFSEKIGMNGLIALFCYAEGGDRNRRHPGIFVLDINGKHVQRSNERLP